MATEAVTEQAFAKVNLCLHVTGPKADGYHLLDSLVVFAGVGDRVRARPADAFALQCEGPFGNEIPAGDDNLILRAARLTAPDRPTRFTLWKGLPPASGIGGGSADAAAAVRGMLRLYPGLPLPDLLPLGADVPVCLASRATRMRGIGEVLDPVPPLPQGSILLVNPRVEVPTPSVFRALTRRQNPPLPEMLPDWPDLPALAAWLHTQRNDLQPAAEVLAPQITETLAALAAQPGQLLTRMSGSGATCFALFRDEAPARTAETALRATHPGWWVQTGPLLP